MSHDPVQPISTFPNTEFAFNNVPITDILVLLLLRLLCDFQIFGRPAECRTCDLDAPFFAPGNSFAIPVDLVNQYSFRITSVVISVSLYCFEEIANFIERFKGNPLYSGVCKIQLGANQGLARILYARRHILRSTNDIWKAL